MRAVKAALLGLLAVMLMASAPAWDAAPWLADLAQLRAAIDRDYPNREWLTGEREVSLDRWFDRAAEAIRASGDDADARRALDRLIERFDDGHLELDWSKPAGAAGAPTASAPADAAAFCKARGYDARQVTAGTAAALPGYRAIDSGGPFAAGLVDAGDRSVGVVRIGIFQPSGYPAVCERAVAAARIPITGRCDAACEDRLTTEAYAILTRGLMATLEQLRGAGAQVLLVDLTRNGGGSEWAEAAARIVTPVALRSAPIGVVRGAGWETRWRALATKLRGEAGRAPRGDRAMLLAYAEQANAVAEGVRPCVGCPRLARAGYASGLLPTLRAGVLDGRTWGVDVFSPAQFPHRDGAWSGPVIVLVDDETWSAAEEFAALLQDNRAAVVMGTRTGGAGCGHLEGGPGPVVLANSGATLRMPNCMRFRKDGSNEVSGVVPDVPTGVRWNDGAGVAGRLTAVRLAEAVAKAEALAAQR